MRETAEGRRTVSGGHMQLLYGFAKVGPACYRQHAAFGKWEKAASSF